MPSDGSRDDPRSVEVKEAKAEKEWQKVKHTVVKKKY